VEVHTHSACNLVRSGEKGALMNTEGNSREKIIERVVKDLCSPDSYQDLIHRGHRDEPMPSLDTISDILKLTRSVLFPGYFGPFDPNPDMMQYYIGSTINQISKLLEKQILRGLCFECEVNTGLSCRDCGVRAQNILLQFIPGLTTIRYLLSTDVRAAYEGDPAAKSPGEVIYCYPSIKAIMNYRIAHLLNKLGAPVLPRIITELAHSRTGIDIHPGAEIGDHFFIDHGTGVVIGETCNIGRNVRLYQGVTLGAKSFPLDENGNPIKGIPRHPIVEDDVTIYAGATILGRITIGSGSVIGGNTWITQDIPSKSTIGQNTKKQS